MPVLASRTWSDCAPRDRSRGRKSRRRDAAPRPRASPNAAPRESIEARFARFAPRASRQQARGRRPPQNFFSVVNFATAAPSRPKTRARVRSDARVLDAASQHDTSKKCAFHGHFCAVADFCCAAASAQKSFAAPFCRRSRRATGGERGAALTHKIKRSHCYFFFAVVIGR